MFRARQFPLFRYVVPGCCWILFASCSERDQVRSYTVEPIRQPEPLTYSVPETWTESVPGSFQLALFRIGTGEGGGEVSISNAGGTPEMNVNRWRGQVGLVPLGEAELVESLEAIEVDGMAARQVHISGEADAIRGVIVPVDESNWFFKLSGPTELVERESDRFDDFVQSVQFAD